MQHLAPRNHGPEQIAYVVYRKLAQGICSSYKTPLDSLLNPEPTLPSPPVRSQSGTRPQPLTHGGRFCCRCRSSLSTTIIITIIFVCKMESEDRGSEILAITWTLTGLAALFVIVRIVWKFRSNKTKLWWDDHVCSLSWVSALSMSSPDIFNHSANNTTVRPQNLHLHHHYRHFQRPRQTRPSHPRRKPPCHRSNRQFYRHPLYPRLGMEQDLVRPHFTSLAVGQMDQRPPLAWHRYHPRLPDCQRPLHVD